MRRLLALVLFATLSASFACGGASDDPGAAPIVASDPKHDTTASPTPTSEPAPIVSDGGDTVAPPIDAGPGGTATTYVGTLDATPATTFGGTPYCKYTVTLKSIDIEVSILPGGQVIGATAKDTMVEGTVAPCTLTPQPANNQTYAFTTMTQLPDGLELAFSGASANRPATKLVVDLKPQGQSYQATATWHRTDQPSPLDWTVKTTITLGPH